MSPITRGLDFWCVKVFEGGQVTFLILFENAFLCALYFSPKFLIMCPIVILMRF